MSLCLCLNRFLQLLVVSPHRSDSVVVDVGIPPQLGGFILDLGEVIVGVEASEVEMAVTCRGQSEVVDELRVLFDSRVNLTVPEYVYLISRTLFGPHSEFLNK
jgi:hypothetical protein